jgi:hydrogenase maturation protein HypF
MHTRAVAREHGVCVRVGVRVGGTVQGVGFRPFVYRLAGELELAGWVRNDERGVQIEVEGEREAVDAFLARLSSQAPPLARVERVSAEPLAPRGEHGFVISPSSRSRDADTPVAADAATCSACLAELLDPGDRRFRYPFVNCTNCGPRFTIVLRVPYDRPFTTMAGFDMCEACRAEYEDPLDRRFHAQPNACPRCGPRARLLGPAGADPLAGADGADGEQVVGGRGGGDVIARAARLLADGAIVAVKGLGGYHLACRADAREPVERLRGRKHREHRPFALMVADLAAARRLALVEEEEAVLLEAPERPIVLAPRRAQDVEGAEPADDPDARVAAAVAPGARELGLMLPYTPLHHLLLADVGELGVHALVMTSGNVCDEPIAYEDQEALARLAPIADAFLLHDRPIHMRVDDSVVRVVRVGGRRRPAPLRRSRGHVPADLGLPVVARRPILACGAELKSTFCLAREGRAWVGQHIGDLANWETLRSFREGVAHFEGLFALTPRVAAHDLHPDYLSTGYARERAEQAEAAGEPLELVGVQHHHAHLAAVLAEHGECGPAVGAIYDGTGYGSDATAWGGELLVGDLAGFERAGHLRPVRLPGGDRAAAEPWRMACAWLAEASGDPRPPMPPALEGCVDARRWAAVAEIAAQGLASPTTSSVGRLYDAVAALCGVRSEVSYEGQAAIELEALADPHERGRYEMPFEDRQLDARPTIAAVLADLTAGAPAASVSARFHNTLAAATASACAELAQAAGLSLVVLAGGVFQNRLLLERVAAGLQTAGLRVLTPERLPANDGAISYGQAAVAAASANGG